MTPFDQAFQIVVGSEGGYSNNPADPGGETRFGISKRAYPNEDIGHLTLDRAKELYRRDYWNRIQGDNLPPSLALVVFDAAVNNGVDRAARWLQQVVGTTQDGLIGSATMGAVQAHRGKGLALLAEYMARRTVFMASLSTWPTFGLGWARRLAALPFHAIAMEQQP